MKYKGGYFPVAPYDHFGELRDEMVIELERAGLHVERAHHEVGTAGQAEINYKFDELLKAADDVMKFKYIVKNVAWRNGKTATFMPKPIFGDNGSGMHVPPVDLERRASPLFYDETGYAGLSDMARYYIGGILKHAPSLLAFTNPTVNSYHRLVPGFEAPITLVYSQRNRSACVRIPITGSNPKAKRIEFRCPDPSANPYLAFSALLLAGLDGIQNKIEPPEPIDKDIYELPPDEMADIDQVPTSLNAVLDSLEADHEFLTVGNVFTPDLIETWIDYKRDQRDPAGAAASAPARVRALLRHLITERRRRPTSWSGGGVVVAGGAAGCQRPVCAPCTPSVLREWLTGRRSWPGSEVRSKLAHPPGWGCGRVPEARGRHDDRTRGAARTRTDRGSTPD